MITCLRTLVLSLVGFTLSVSLLASPWGRDIVHLITTNSDDRRCFRSIILTPVGAKTEKDAPLHEIPLDTPISWEPSRCVMDIECYGDKTLLEKSKGQISGKATVRQACQGHAGTVEVKIFREGFETPSSNVWIMATR